MQKTPEQLERITILFNILKKTSVMYRKANNSQKEQLFDKFLPYVDQLVELGYPRDLCESLMMFGDEFLKVPNMIHSPHYRSQYPEIYSIFLTP